ncbi:MAG TPA: VOC family protein [Actinomycetota bacterium]|jgi:predicted 3-demethylubiquinone-9 3-methyltransferase (glyoxalase superfamily)|nr:VOC family protein [Actinomycetota bacterium]
MAQKVVPYLWFDKEAEEAATLYVDLFKSRPGTPAGESKVIEVNRYTEGGPGEPGTAMVVSFELDGEEFTALNGGPQFNFTEAVSFLVRCESQDEVDYFWNALTADGGEESQCGWLKDRFGLSWQIIPNRLMELLGDPDPGRSQRAMQAMLQMQKIDVAELERAADAA